MAGDFSRSTFDPTRHYSGVLMQQGRVLLDAEWNEQLDIQQQRTTTETRHVIGLCGTPEREDGFLIQQTPHGSDLIISPGHYYVDGLLCTLEGSVINPTLPQGENQKLVLPYLYLDGYNLEEQQWVELRAANSSTPLYAKITNVDTASLTLTVDTDLSSYRNKGPLLLRRSTTFTTQPSYPGPKSATSSPPQSPSGEDLSILSDGTYLVYLVAWDREVNALEDPRIREVALGGPDTTERRQTVWQVRLLPAGAMTSPPQMRHSSPPLHSACCSDFSAWKEHIAPPTGTMNARSVPPSGNQGLCALPPTAGYQRLDNQLYRIEVFQGSSSRAGSKFVWSRDNATLQTTIVKIDNADLYLTSLGKDDYFSFGSGQWVEIVSPESELGDGQRFLAKITSPPDTSGPNPRISLSHQPPAYSDVSKLRLVRWDMTDSVTDQGISMKAGWVDIEAGVQVQFAEGTYRTGDYWLIPARTATGDLEWPPFEVPNSHPVPQPPLGIRRHYCCLATLDVSGGAWNLQDCRKTFPPLTHLCADDICYEGSCDIEGITTVQDAIDKLCQQRDLRFHNKHLHGWGVVCGLKVTCGPDAAGQTRRHVSVSAGYAIDCNGNDVYLSKAPAPLDILSMVAKLPPPPPTSPPAPVFPDGDYSLILDSSVPGNFKLEEYVPKSFLDSILNDTLLLDIYNDCLLTPYKFLKDRFTAPGTATEPAGPGHRLTAAGINLIAPFINADVGSYVFLSGDSKQSVETQYHEDLLLRNFYTELRTLLQSHTYCGMFDNARPFPGTQGSTVKYPYSGLNIATIFGTDCKTRLRVDPTGQRAFAVGVDTAIHVFDLKTQKMAAITQFPDTGASPGDVVVQDVAFSADGTQIYAVASLNNLNTMFALGSLSGTTITWQKQVVIANVVLATLGTLSSATGQVFAIGVGKGLYQFDVQGVFTNPNLNPKLAFNAFEHLSIHDASGMAVATALSKAGAPTFFDEVVLLNLKDVGTLNSYSLPGAQGTIDDDVTIFQAGAEGPVNQDMIRIGVAVKTASVANKQIWILSLNQFRQQAAVTPIDSGETSSVRLAYNQSTSLLMVSMESNFRVMLLEPLKPALLQNVFPAQIQPIGIAPAAQSNLVLVLNYLSRTITAYSADLLQPARQIELQPLVDYRSAVLTAFYDLLGGFLEYLKDCVCEHLLVDCPSCDDDDKLYLGVVSIRDKQVFKICNFAQRKYVKSFPTVGYWLSAIPVFPILGKLVEMFCCAALPDLLAKTSAPQPSKKVAVNPAVGSGAVKKINLDAVRGAITVFKQTSFKGLMQSAITSASPAPKFVTDFLAQKGLSVTPATAAVVQHSELVGAASDTAKTRLQTAGAANVNVVRYDPSALRQNLTAFAAAPPNVGAGDSVTLVVNDDNQVMYYTRSSPEVTALQSQVQAGQQQIKQNSDQLSQITASNDQLKKSLDSVQQTLTSNQPALTAAAALQSRVANLETLTATQQSEVQSSLNQIKLTAASMDQFTTTSQQLKDLIDATNKTIAASQPSLDAAKNLQSQVDALKTQLAAQQTAHDQALAQRDHQITELTNNTKTLQTQLQQLSTKLPGPAGPHG